MSFGSYAESSTLKLALENAYATSILVAAAGNNGKRIGARNSFALLYILEHIITYLGVEDRPRPPLEGYTQIMIKTVPFIHEICNIY